MTYRLFCILLLNCFFFPNNTFSQDFLSDSSTGPAVSTPEISLQKNEQLYNLKNEETIIYKKPKRFGFITDLPNDALGILVTSFKRENIKPLLLTTGATLALMLADQHVSNGVRQFSDNIHFSSEESYKDIISLKAGKTDISIYKAPQNLNTGLYQLGQGFPGLLIGGGLFVYGKVRHDYRALSTASQLAETFILMGVGTQILKRITGRQSPSNASEAGGNWRFFPSFKNYQTQTPNYDAFPSGHLATLISTVTVLADNYPEKKYIRPVGYAVTGLVGLAMINNNVHWVSDYPLAIALGYLCARQVIKKHRKVINQLYTAKPKRALSYTLNYSCGRLMPGIIYRF